MYITECKDEYTLIERRGNFSTSKPNKDKKNCNFHKTKFTCKIVMIFSLVSIISVQFLSPLFLDNMWAGKVLLSSVSET